ncbi:hypothetical protein M758_2G123100 [Ceratodon purpureus]|nr:hypothetical protein M758_2G123100 [Ceratodon purpureus]
MGFVLLMTSASTIQCVVSFCNDPFSTLMASQFLCLVNTRMVREICVFCRCRCCFKVEVGI